MPEDEEVSYLDLGEDLDNVPDEKTVPAGEYELRLAAMELTTTKKDASREMLSATLEVIGEPLAKTIYHYLLIPKQGDDVRQALRRKRSIKRFYQAFGIPLSGRVNFQEYLNNAAWAVLAEESTPDYGQQNRITRFVESGK